MSINNIFFQEQFIQFLKEHDALESYHDNWAEKHPHTSFNEWCIIYSPKDWINCAFTWCTTNQNHNFWCVLNFDWYLMI